MTGSIYPLENPVYKFVLGETIFLRINISRSQHWQTYIQNVSWYHNGTRVCDCRTQNNGTQLIIPNVQERDAGLYQAKVTSLNFNKPHCDSRLLPQLESLAMLAPVTYILTQGMSALMSDNVVFNPNTSFQVTMFTIQCK